MSKYTHFQREKTTANTRKHQELITKICDSGAREGRGRGTGGEKISGIEEKAPVVTKSVKQLYVKIIFLSV